MCVYMCVWRKKSESVTKPQCFPLLPSLLSVSPFFYKLPLPSVSVPLSHRQSTSFCLSFSQSLLHSVLSHSGSVAFLRPSYLAAHLPLPHKKKKKEALSGVYSWGCDSIMRGQRRTQMCVVLQVNCTHLLFTKYFFCACLFDPVSANITRRDMSSFPWGHKLQCCWGATTGGNG